MTERDAHLLQSLETNIEVVIEYIPQRIRLQRVSIYIRIKLCSKQHYGDGTCIRLPRWGTKHVFTLLLLIIVTTLDTESKV